MKNRLPHITPTPCSFRFPQQFTALACAAALCGLPSALQAQTELEDFNDGDDTFPLVWTHNDALADASLGGIPHLTVSFPGGNTCKLAAAGRDTPPIGLPPQVGPARGGSLVAMDRADFHVSVDVVAWTPTLNSAFGILARIQPDPGLAATAGYSFTYQSDDHEVQISRITGESPSALVGTVKSLTLDPAKKYRVVFQGKDDYLEGRIYDLEDLATPLIVVQGKDGTYASGVSGVVVYDNGDGLGGADATFDNFLANGAPSFVPCHNPVLAADTFNDGNANGWTRYLTTSNGTAVLTDATWTLPGGAGEFGYRLTCGPTTDLATFTNASRVAGFLMDGPEIADFIVSADLTTWDDTLTQRMGVMARVQAPVPTASTPSLADLPQGYALVYVNRRSSAHGGTDQLRIYKLGPGQFDFISGTGSPALGNLGQFGVVSGGSLAPTPTNGKPYRLVFKGVGNLLMGQIIDLNTGLPMTFNDNAGKLTNTVWANDYRIAANPAYTQGHVGLLGILGDGAPATGLDATYDNFCATAAPPPVSLTPNGENVEISWSAHQEGIWVLESSAELSASAVWTEVPFSALTFADGRFNYSAPMAESGFFRLRSVWVVQ